MQSLAFLSPGIALLGQRQLQERSKEGNRVREGEPGRVERAFESNKLCRSVTRRSKIKFGFNQFDDWKERTALRIGARVALDPAVRCGGELVTQHTYQP